MADGDASPERGELSARAERPSVEGCAPFGSAWEAIQTRIFAAHGCAADVCHGRQAAGGLSLMPAQAYGALVNVAARSSSLRLVEPEKPDLSYLMRKLLAATAPGSVAIAGSPMPVGGPALRAGELEAIRVWIAAGAPPAATDVGARALTARVTELLGACEPASDAASGADQPLPVPDSERGIQLRMPLLVAKPQSEWEGCFATYHDLRKVVPARFQNAAGTAFRVKATEMHQSAGSHHLTIMPTGLHADRVHDPAFGAWTCKGGAKSGAACEPLDPGSCGDDGLCGSAPRAGVACFGHGPFGTFLNPSVFGLGKSGQTTLVVSAIPGVYREIGLEGIIFWNLHAFNLTDGERVQTAQINFYYTDDVRYQEQNLSLSVPGYAGIPPFTKRDVCGTWRAPKGSTLVRLSSHTHRHGQRFWITDPAGQLIYESRDYANPTYLVLEPPRVFNANDPAARTLRYCATFNNGLKPDGTFDTELVTRRSRVPRYAATTCTPTACAAGKIGAACRGVADHARCDTSPGRGDGSCDACPTMAGETTEHEMFVMHPDYIPAVIQ